MQAKPSPRPPSHRTGWEGSPLRRHPRRPPAQVLSPRGWRRWLPKANLRQRRSRTGCNGCPASHARRNPENRNPRPMIGSRGSSMKPRCPTNPSCPRNPASPIGLPHSPSADQPGTDFGAEIRVATTGWLREVGEEATPPDALEPASTPDWLKEFEAAGPPAASPTDRTVVAGRSADWGQTAGDARPPVGNMDASTAGELGEDDVQKWLEALASRQEAGSGAGIEEAPPAEASSFFPPGILPEPAAPPEEAEDGMEWLDQLSGQPKPEPAAPSWQPVDQEPEAPRAEVLPSADAEDEEVPDWLRSLAAEGEVVQPAEAEVAAEDQAPDWLLTAASSTVVRRASVEIPAPPVPPEPPEAPEASGGRRSSGLAPRIPGRASAAQGA